MNGKKWSIWILAIVSALLIIYLWLAFNWDKYYVSYTGLVWKDCRGSIYVPDTQNAFKLKGLTIAKCVFDGKDEPWYFKL